MANKDTKGIRSILFKDEFDEEMSGIKTKMEELTFLTESEADEIIANAQKE